MGRRIGAWLGWLAAAFLLYFFENNTGTRAVLLISLLVPLLSIGCAYMTAQRISIFLRAPEKAHTGQKTRWTATLRGPLWRLGCTVTCRMTGRNEMTGETDEAEIVFPYSGTYVRETESSRCGCILLTLSHAEIRDWFGLARHIRDFREEAAVLVEPDLYPVAVRTDPDSGTSSRGNGGAHRPAEDPEPGDLRLYIPGDDVRRIHWKLSEKTNQTLVRESVPEALDLIALLAETSFPERIDPEAMHETIRGLLSVSGELAAEGVAHAVILEKNGEAVLTEVTGGESFRQAEEQVLTASGKVGGTSVGTLFHLQYPDIRFRRMILFSPHPEVDMRSPAEHQAVTLALPFSVPFAYAETGIRVTVLDPADARIEI